MPPRFSYWTILAGGLPTSFRAADREDLLPTLRRLKERHPDAEMKWFQRGKLWESPDAARADLEKARVRRERDWRPGGEHRDPRAPFQKAKRERNQALRQKRFARKHGRSDGKPEGPSPDRQKLHPPRRRASPLPFKPRQPPKGGRRR